MNTAIEIVVSALIPFALFVVNWRVRVRLKYELSAASDFALAILGFDCCAIAAHDVFQKAMHATDFQDKFVALFMIFGLVALILWVWFFLDQEDALTSIANKAITLPNEGVLRFGGVWTVAVILFAAHVSSFYISGSRTWLSFGFFLR